MLQLFMFVVSVLEALSQSSRNLVASAAEMYCFTVVEARSLQSGRGLGWFLRMAGREDPSPACALAIGAAGNS